MWCVAFCLQRLKNDDISTELRKDFHNFISTAPRNILVFANFYKYWSSQNEKRPEENPAGNIDEAPEENPVGSADESTDDGDMVTKRKQPRRKRKKIGGSLAFGRGMRTCLKRWYDSFSHEDLIEFMFVSPAVNGIKHTDILKQIHLYCDKKKKKPEDEQTSKKVNSWPKVEKPTPDALKKLIVESASWWNPKKFKDQENENKNIWVTGHKMRKIVFYRRIKQTTDAQIISNIVNKGRQEFNFKLEHLPHVGFKSESLSKIIDGMPITKTIDALATLNTKKDVSLRLNFPILKAIKKNLSKTNTAIKEAHLNPLHVFDERRKFEAKFNKKYGRCEVVEDYKTAHGAMLDKLLEVVNKSLSDQPKTGCRYYVTLDLRKFSKRRKHRSTTEAN